MGRSVASAVKHALKQREFLVQRIQHANARCDEGQALQLEYMLETIDGLLALVTCTTKRK
jgi:hypothetical protein